MTIIELFKHIQETTPTREENGKTVYLDDQGEVIQNAIGNPASLEELTDLKYRQQAGMTQQQQQPEGIPENVKSQMQLHAHLVRSGLRPDSKEFMQKFSELGKGLPFKLQND